MSERHTQKSPFRESVDEIQRVLRDLVRPHGFRSKGRTFNRTTEDGLTQVIGLQMAASDPPGTTRIPGFRENLHGRFTVNLGVYVPEVAAQLGVSAPSWVQDSHCCVRARLGALCAEKADLAAERKPFARAGGTLAIGSTTMRASREEVWCHCGLRTSSAVSESHVARGYASQQA